MINEMEKDVARVLISEEQIRQRVKEMGAQGRCAPLHT